MLVPQSPAGSSRLLSLAVLVTAAVLFTPARAQTEQLEVGVRSSVPDTTYLWSHDKAKVKGDGGHSKLYGILNVAEIKSDQRLVKPVDENYLTSLLIMHMASNGFHQIVAGQRPDIIITMSYGRGELANPYLKDMGTVSGANPGLPTSPPGDYERVPVLAPPNNTPMATQTVVGDAQQLFDELRPGFLANAAKAAFEKLFIRITAWNFPSKGQKPLILWKTVMVVDDPDHHDLNIVAEKMIEAGAPYFDKEPKDKEVLLQKPWPTARVDLGMPRVVDPAAHKK